VAKLFTLIVSRISGSMGQSFWREEISAMDTTRSSTGTDLSAVRCDEHDVRLGQEYLDMLPPPPRKLGNESVQEKMEGSMREEMEAPRPVKKVTFNANV
jgi:hypothetical protein